jgi:hypothetical protein
LKSVKVLAALVLVVGVPTMGFLTFAVAVSFLVYIFREPPLGRQILGYVSLVGPIPLWTGAILLFFPRTGKLGARLALAGSFIMTVYLVTAYSMVDVRAPQLVTRMLLFGVVPVAVLAVDYMSYRAYPAVQAKDKGSKESAAASQTSD